MPHLTTDDAVKLYYEEVGSGIPIVFVHEFAGDFRSYELQLRYFGQRYRCIAFNARGYPRRMYPGTASAFRKTAPAMTSARCSMRSKSTRRISSAYRWVDLRLCTSVSPIPTALVR